MMNEAIQGQDNALSSQSNRTSSLESAAGHPLHLSALSNITSDARRHTDLPFHPVDQTMNSADQYTAVSMYQQHQYRQRISPRALMSQGGVGRRMMANMKELSSSLPKNSRHLQNAEPYRHPSSMAPMTCNPAKASAHLPSISSTDNYENNKGRSPQHQPIAIIPCRARGMPPDHNSKTAYFVIPPARAEHGGNLVCSYPSCQAGGIKFCYCSTCGIAVARRNFRQRHDHNQQFKDQKKKSKGSSSNMYSSETPPNHGQDQQANMDTTRILLPAERADASRNEKKGKKKKSNKKKTASSCESSSDELSSGATFHSEVSFETGHRPKPMLSPVFENNNNTSNTKPVTSSESDENQGLRRLSKKQEWRWATLLRQRPNVLEGDAMSAWLMSVMEVSNPEAQLESSSSTNTKHKGVTQNDSSRSPSAGSAKSIIHAVAGLPQSGALRNAESSSCSSESSRVSGSSSSPSSSEGISSDLNSDDTSDSSSEDDMVKNNSAGTKVETFLSSSLEWLTSDFEGNVREETKSKRTHDKSQSAQHGKKRHSKRMQPARDSSAAYAWRENKKARAGVHISKAENAGLQRNK